MTSINPPSAPEDALVASRRAATALGDALNAGDLAAASDVLRLHWLDLLRDEIRDEALEKLEALSSAQLTTHPLLAVALGLRYNADPHRRSKAPYYFGLASLGIRNPAHRASTAECALILAAESVCLRLAGRFSLAVGSARAGAKALDAIREDRGELIGYLPRVYAHLGTSLYYGGHEDEALRVYERGYAEAGTTDRSSFSNLSMLAGIHALAGNLPEASEYVGMARGEPWTDEQRSYYIGTFYRIAEAVLALERSDAASARAHLDAMVHDCRSIEHWTTIARVEAMTALVTGDAADGLAQLESFVVQRGTEGQGTSARRRLASVRSLLHVALGNYEAAEAVLGDAGGRSPQDAVDRARLCLVHDRTSEALRALRAIAGRPQSLRTRAEALAIEAAIGLRTGGGGRSDAVVQQLVSVLRRSGQRLALRLVPERDVAALRSAIERLRGEYAAVGGDPDSLLLSRPLPALTPRELAVLEALARDPSVSGIAAELYVSANTVKSQLRSVYRKLGARNRDEALTVALFHHLIRPAPPVDAGAADLLAESGPGER